MKISIVDTGSGITQEFARAIGARVDGRFVHIPESRGAGYLTGFNWNRDLRMMIRNYHLKQDVFIERTNQLAEGQEDIVFLLSGVFPPVVYPPGQLLAEPASIMICRHAVSTMMAMPSNTTFESVTIAASKTYLHQLFGHVEHPVVVSVLQARDNFVFETGISQEIIKVASDFLQQPIPESIASQYYKSRCDELLCHIFAILMQREAVPVSTMHINDIKAIYAIKAHLQSNPDQPPNIAALARQAGMSEPKLRKLFKQTFGKGVFEYYQSGRMQKAAQMLKENKLTVSEVGYRLGFTNLSHFSRVFEQYTGVKPKKYATLSALPAGHSLRTDFSGSVP